MDQEKTPKKGKRVQWDEERLKQTQKTRGMFMKIDEPKTPYHGNSDDEEEIQTEGKTQEQLQVQLSLQQAQKNRQQNRRGKIDLTALNEQLKKQMQEYKNEDNEMDEEEEQEAMKRKEEFKKKRAAHYNQFKMIQKTKQSQWQSDDDE